MKKIIASSALLLVCSISIAQHSKTIQVEDWEKRINERQPIPKVIEVMGVKPGMTIGEIGAGTGRVTVWLADAVGNKGMVYANDIDTKSLDHLKDRCKREGLNNVIIIVGTVDDPKLPAASLDIAFMTNTYHHLDKPVDLVKKILPSLKENGYLVVVERDKERCPPTQRNEATTISDFKKQMNEAGFEVVKVDTTMRIDNIYIARPKK